MSDPRAVTVMIPMTYEGGLLSKNLLWRGGKRRAGMNPVASAWKAALAESVRMAFLAEGVRQPALPLNISIWARYRSPGFATDPQNLVELIADAVEEGTGLNDLYYTITTHAPEFGGEPGITIAITAHDAPPVDKVAARGGGRRQQRGRRKGEVEDGPARDDENSAREHMIAPIK